MELLALLLPYALGTVLLGWILWRVLQRPVDPLAQIRKDLGSADSRVRELAMRRAQALSSLPALALLLNHVEQLDGNGDKGEWPTLFRALIDGWGAGTIVKNWERFPVTARFEMLELAMAGVQLSRREILPIARHAMEDTVAKVAEQAWRTYARTVTDAFDHPESDFDIPLWLYESLKDSNADIQGLRSRLEQKRLAEAQVQGVEGVVSRYRKEAFKVAVPNPVQLHASREYELQQVDGGELIVPEGQYSGTLTGSFDNAQNAVTEGWKFCIDLEELVGHPRRIEATWHSSEFFAEILDERHDANRHWVEGTQFPFGELFSRYPFVGPVVAYGDTWGELTASIDGEPLVIRKQQLLKCLIACPEPMRGKRTQLAFLLYGVEDGADEDEELGAFVTMIPLERWMLAAEAEDRIEELTIQQLGS